MDSSSKRGSISSSSCYWPSSQYSGSDRSSSRSRSSSSRSSSSDDIEIFLLPSFFKDLLAQPGKRLLADMYDCNGPLWILAAPEHELDYNEWEVAYNEAPFGHEDNWVIRCVVRWWGAYEDPHPEYTDWFIEPLIYRFAVDDEPVL